jgi:hypothetical protein
MPPVCECEGVWGGVRSSRLSHSCQEAGQGNHIANQNAKSLNTASSQRHVTEAASKQGGPPKSE